MCNIQDPDIFTRDESCSTARIPIVHLPAGHVVGPVVWYLADPFDGVDEMCVVR
jgi:hypothetical protein